MIIVSQLTYTPGYAGTSMIQMHVSCEVTRGSNIAHINTTPTISKVCPITSSFVGEYAVSCPIGTSVAVTYHMSDLYDENSKICKVASPDEPVPDIYTDPACTNKWDPNSVKSYAFSKDKMFYNKPLFCKTKSINKKDFYVMDITINY